MLDIVTATATCNDASEARMTIQMESSTSTLRGSEASSLHSRFDRGVTTMQYNLKEAVEERSLRESTQEERANPILLIST